MPNWVDEGTRSTCRYCGMDIVWTLPNDVVMKTSYGGRDPYEASKFHYANWWHLPGDYKIKPGDIHDDGHKFQKDHYSELTRWGPMFRACPSEDWKEDKFGHHTARPTDFCDESTNYSSHCKRPVKDEDLFMCGVHARAERQRRASSEQMQQRMDLQHHIGQELDPIVARLNDFWGLDASKHYDQGFGGRLGHWSGKVVVDPVRLLEILDKKVEEF